MKTKISTVFFLLFLSAFAANAQIFLKVDEAQTKAAFADGRLLAEIALENSARELNAKIKLEILDAEDKVLAASETAQIVRRGRQILRAPVAFSVREDAVDLLWKRLRYTIAAENSPDFAAGIVSLSEIMPEVFELQVSAPENIYSGMNLRAHVLALHPLTKKPIKAVEIAGEISLDVETEADEDELIIKAKGKTNAEGFATLEFQIPANITIDGCCNELKIKGEKNGIAREAEEDFEDTVESFVYLTTDKPIYQPAQKLFVRGLYLDPFKRPLAERDLEFEIADEEGETVHEGTIRTSRFGVANIEWQLPENLKLGKYSIEIEGDESAIGAAEFKVSRYDLPNFTVSAETAKSFYLLDESEAEITVGGQYLFGKPVAGGKVKIVREKERRWNYDEQKWEIDEGAAIEGETGADGRFAAKLDLREAQEALRGDNWKRFADVKFAAYFTDSTTNRTEMKRFDVRISKEPIHTYFIRQADEANPKMPFLFYVSTFYADGAPARCELKIEGNYKSTTLQTKLAEAKTNAYGASRFEIRFPEKPFPEAENEFEFRIFAEDKKGNRGTFADNIYVDENARQIRVATDKTVYLPGEPVEAKIFSTENEQTVFVDVVKESGVVYSKRVRLEDGRARLSIPARADFKGEVTIAAYFNGEDEDGDRVFVGNSKTVLFPAPHNLNLSVKSLKTAYRPNEEARISFSAENGERKRQETALGVLVLDKAIEERARTEQLPDNFGALRKLLGTADVFGSVTRRDLDNLDLSKPITEDLQLAAEFLLVNKTFKPNFFESDSYRSDFGRIYADYFAKKLAPFENVLNSHFEKTAEFPKDENSLRQILAAGGINFDELRDAWNAPFRAEFSADRRFAILTLKTASADKKFETGDDFTARVIRFEWFRPQQNRLDAILNNFLQENGGAPPATPEELKNVWQRGGVDTNALRDGWNRPLYLTSAKYSRNLQKIVHQTVSNLDGEKQQVLTTKLVEQEVVTYRLRSTGADGAAGETDDFDLASFTVVLSEKDLSGEKTLSIVSKSPIAGASGAVGGSVFDPNGAVIPGTKVTAENQNSGEKFAGESNENGEFLIANLPSGKYKITAEASHFQKYVIQNVVVSAMNLIELKIYLDVGSISATVDVAADSQSVIDQSSSAIKNVTESRQNSIAGFLAQNKNAPNFTPRVREYFPETLLWQPELVTDKNGRAELKFKLGDNLTTWKLYAVGSTETGEIGLVEKEFQTFQPFFAELDPPKILTEGDEIALPVPIRNYTDKRQKVAVSMAENDWSRILSGAVQNIEIAPNAAHSAVFNFRAAAPVKAGKQKVSALAKSEGDAVEKTIEVKPNGRENVRAQSRMFEREAAFDVDFPADAFANSRKTGLKIYPNMLAHVAESVEGLLKRPYGCGEQTTSSTYPNLLILKIEKQLKKEIDPQIRARAKAYLDEGYKRLLNYQTPAGGFSYWGKTDVPNAALTAYVLRFLKDAREFTEVDESVTDAAEKWLSSRQKADGSWESNRGNPDVSTAYIARALSLNAESGAAENKSLHAALAYLRNRLPQTKDPYVLANFALAAEASGDRETARAAIEKLKTLAQTKNETVYWKTPDTPFYGWGTVAEIETTALVVQAFLRAKENGGENGDLDKLISGGTMFLLRNKDKFGVWHSTQTTVNVLDALISLQEKSLAGAQGGDGKLEIFVNGAKVGEFTAAGEDLKNPYIFHLSPHLAQTANSVEIKGGSGIVMAQIVSEFYTDWRTAEKESEFFALDVNFSKTEAKIGEEISCAVRAQRKNYNRSGMLLAEIGLPPGADVDRASLEKAKAEGKFSSYDVLPDRVVVYFWASAAMLDFNFKFKPRFGLNAQTAPSVVYDYYNEGASATLAPARFFVK